MFIDSYVRRPDLNMTRNGATLMMPVLNISGALSPHMEETVTLNSRLDPTNSSWMKVTLNTLLDKLIYPHLNMVLDGPIRPYLNDT